MRNLVKPGAITKNPVIRYLYANYFLSSEERLDRSSVDEFFSGETGVISHR